MELDEPWSNFTVEAEPSEPVLVSALLERTEQLEQARMWAVGLGQRLDEVYRILSGAKDSPADRRCRIRQALRAIDAELVADA